MSEASTTVTEGTGGREFFAGRGQELTYEPNRMPDDPYSIDLEDIDVSDPYIYQRNMHWGYFERLRKEAPVHYCKQSELGPYVSVTGYDDIMHVDRNHKLFSNEPAITINNQADDFKLPMFIAMDPPKHDEQRRVASPVVAARNLRKMEPLIRSRVTEILDNLPVGEEFNWVDRVSIELTTRMLATLFDFPFEERRKLTRWSDVTTANLDSGIVESEDHRRAELMECLAYFQGLWQERVGRDPNEHFDLITMLANSEATGGMEPMEYLGNLLLLIVGGNDTTRNSITGGVVALNEFPGEYNKLRNDPRIIPNMVAEIIRWQTPLAHMRRIATEDVEVGDQEIRKGEKVIMWYVSGNRDSNHFEDPDKLIIDRPNARSHLSFGFGIHRCMGNRLGEMQLQIVWEEVMKRFHMVEVVGEPTRILSNFVKGYSHLPVVLHKD